MNYFDNENNIEFDKKIKVLGLALYGERAASARVRLSQYIEPLLEKNIEMEVNHLLIDDYVKFLSTRKNFPFYKILCSFFRRLKLLFRIKNYDLVILHCELLPFVPAWIERLLLRKTKYIYDLDDAFYLKYQSGKYGYLKWFLGKKFDHTIKKAAFVNAGNQNILDYVTKFNSNAQILPSVVNTDIYKANDESIMIKDELVIGWIGSPSTSEYLNNLIDEFEELGKSINIKLKIIGANFPSLNNVKVECFEWNIDKEINDLNSFDIGIMPLTDDPWSRGKCGYKLIQYMSCKIPVIASNVGVNSTIVDKECGILATDNSDWSKAIKFLFNEPETRIMMGQAARKKIIESYSLKANIPKLCDSIIRILK